MLARLVSPNLTETNSATVSRYSRNRKQSYSDVSVGLGGRYYALPRTLLRPSGSVNFTV